MRARNGCTVIGSERMPRNAINSASTLKEVNGYHAVTRLLSGGRPEQRTESVYLVMQIFPGM